MSTLACKNVAYAYEKGKGILTNISFSFESGKMYAILGPSGSGKTTLLSLLGGLDTPAKGNILFDDTDITQTGLEEHRRNHISLIFQNYNLIDYMTPIENTKLVSKVDAVPILQRLGLTEDELRRTVLKLSGGQQQRVAIARSLASDAPVILADEYDQLWLDDSAAIVGEDNAQAAVEKMSSMVTGTVTGEEAVETYKDGNMAYDCEFLQNIDQFTFDGTTISGVDEEGNDVFSHSYHYVGMEETRGLYIYESDDADSGEFTYFCIAPDTMKTTWHIEFRYGSDLDALEKYDAGEYAYWLAAGISVDYTKADVENCIQLFCKENLSE